MQKYSGEFGDCSPEMLKTLEEFKIHISHKMKVTDPRYDDRYLLRFCRARNFNLPKVIEMFENFIKWRKENDVDNICKKPTPNMKKTWEYYPHGYYTTTREGLPVYIERYGNLKIKKIFELCPKEELVNYYIASYERLLHIILPACSRAAGKEITRSLTILDCKGLGIRQCMKSDVRAFMKLASSIAQDYYPEIMGKMFIINTPMLFGGVWSIVKLFLDKKTRAKITVKSSGWKKELKTFIDEKNVPDFLGGKNKIPLGTLTGPWKEDYAKSLQTGELFLTPENGEMEEGGPIGTPQIAKPVPGHEEEANPLGDDE